MKLLNSCLLIIGTAVGAGMLGMPVITAPGGYVPSLFLLVFSWVASYIAALFFVEGLAFLKESVNLTTLSEKILGKSTKAYILIVYLILFTSLIFAYTKGGGIFLTGVFSSLPTSINSLVFLAFFFPFLMGGAKTVGKINFLLSLPMAISFLLIVTTGLGQINGANLTHSNWRQGFLSLPILITAFSFHGIIPSLFNYLHHNKREIRKAITIGSLSTLCIYVCWQTYIMGIVPLRGEISLLSALSNDQTAITPLQQVIQSPLLTNLAGLFYFCALTTSFLGVCLGLVDFLIDALKIKNTRYNKAIILLLLFIPAYILSGTTLRVFYLSLKYGSGLACTLLLVLFPTFLLMKLRRKHPSLRKTPIWKIGIATTLLYSAAVFFFQIASIAN